MHVYIFQLKFISNFQYERNTRVLKKIKGQKLGN